MCARGEGDSDAWHTVALLVAQGQGEAKLDKLGQGAITGVGDHGLHVGVHDTQDFHMRQQRHDVIQYRRLAPAAEAIHPQRSPGGQ